MAISGLSRGGGVCVHEWVEGYVFVSGWRGMWVVGYVFMSLTLATMELVNSWHTWDQAFCPFREIVLFIEVILNIQWHFWTFLCREVFQSFLYTEVLSVHYSVSRPFYFYFSLHPAGPGLHHHHCGGCHGGPHSHQVHQRRHG